MSNLEYTQYLLTVLIFPAIFSLFFFFLAIMKVYEDFFLYKEGIYRHSYKAGSKWKTHSVKLLG